MAPRDDAGGPEGGMTARDYEMAPCLRDGPLAGAGRELVRTARGLGTSALASIWRAWTVPALYDGMDRVFANDDDPTPQIVDLLRRLTETLDRQRGVGWEALLGSPAPAALPPDDERDLQQLTGDHFSNLFAEFSTDRFFEQPLEKFCTRLERNGVSRDVFAGKTVLDAGCGAGRFSVAMRRLGASSVTGIDIAPTNIVTARRYVERAGLDHVDFQVGSVLELPFADGSFDLVLSFGVLHHTPDWKRGIGEMIRVLRSGGVGLIMYLNENPGGLFWDVLEIVRVIMWDESHAFARRALELAGVERERIIMLLDPAMVPINVRLTPDEIEACLAEHGATKVRRFERGADTDRVERVYQCTPFAREKYGTGDNRYVFEKP